MRILCQPYKIEHVLNARLNRHGVTGLQVDSDRKAVLILILRLNKKGRSPRVAVECAARLW